jgi:UDPglucose 6-dehydrogenase
MVIMNTAYSVIGLGKLGASMAAAIAKQGFHVIGVDVNKHAVELLNTGHAPVQETELEEMIVAHKTRLRATLSYEDAILNSDVTFVIVPTPSDERGAFTLQYAVAAFRDIGQALKKKSGYHNVVLTSTVLPGATRYGLLPILERESGKRCGPNFGLCYSPEFIALGSVIHDFLNPDFTLVGEYDERAGSQLEACYAQIMMNNPPCQRMSIENAELTKISINTFVTTKITFANMLAELCERIPGGDVDVVTNALGLDRRIGRKYLTGALGYGGPCFPRDNVALGFIARELETRAALAETTDSINRSLPEKILARLHPMLNKNATVAILGLAYKPFSHVIEESQGFMLAEALANMGYRVLAYDPLAKNISKQALGPQITLLDSIAECLQQAEVIFITTADPKFRSLTITDFTNSSQKTVIDFWRILDQQLIGQPNIRYIPIGRSLDDLANAERLRQLWGETADQIRGQ